MMAGQGLTIPGYDLPTVEPAGLPAVRQSAPTRMMMYESGQGGRELAGMGRSIMQASGDMAAIKNQQNIAAVKDLDANFTDQVTQLLHDPKTGYLNQLGKTAVDGQDAALTALSKLQQSSTDGIEDPAQQAMFERATARTVLAAKAAILQHASRQTSQYNLDSSMARGEAAKQAAISGYSPLPGADNSLYDQSLLKQRIELEQQAKQQGLAGPLAKQYVMYGKDGHSGLVSTYTAVVTHLMDTNQPDAAKAYFAGIKAELPQSVADKVQQSLNTATARSDSLALAMKLKTKGDLATQQTQLDDMFHSGKIDQQVHDYTLTRLRADHAQQENLQRDNDRTVLGNIWAQKEQNPGMTTTDLPASTLAYIQHRNLGPQVDRMMAAGPATDNPRLFLDLMKQAHDEPTEFLNEDLTKFYGQLSKAHQRQVESAYQAVLKQDPTRLDAMRITQQALGDVKAAVVAAGLNPVASATNGSGEASDYDKFEVAVHDAITAAEQDSKKPLTRDEAAGIARGMLKDATLAGTGWFGSKMGETTEKVYKMTPAERAAPWEIPPALRPTIEAKLKAGGLPVTEANVQRYYKLTFGVR